MVRFLLSLILLVCFAASVEAQCVCGPACRCEPCLCGLVRTVSSVKADPGVKVITMQGCKPCGELKKALAAAPLADFKAVVVDRLDAKELVRKHGVRSFPTILVLRADGTVAWRQSGFDGNARKLADNLSAALNATRRPVRRR